MLMIPVPEADTVSVTEVVIEGIGLTVAVTAVLGLTQLSVLQLT